MHSDKQMRAGDMRPNLLFFWLYMITKMEHCQGCTCIVHFIFLFNRVITQWVGYFIDRCERGLYMYFASNMYSLLALTQLKRQKKKRKKEKQKRTIKKKKEYCILLPWASHIFYTCAWMCKYRLFWRWNNLLIFKTLKVQTYF